MPRNLKGLQTNRTDILSNSPKVQSAGQPNGKPVQADVPTGLPYGERGQLTSAIRSTPRPPGRPVPPPPTSVDYSQHPDIASVLGNWQPNPVTPIGAPTERPDEDPMTGAIGTPTSVLSQAAPGGLADYLDSLVRSGGSSSIGDLATLARGEGA